ncbi:hypothetical protein OC842_006609 [Tilletia horrida]|uniref:Endo-1,3-beta-glucanase btgC n=1 Tax=Tilletia horrida TaxID=155126 RepID=A0AAN6G566_9BASI|nr:hypothetical protein OC842_006609 [Tilletia horrida]
MASSASASGSSSSLKTRRPLSGVFAIDKPSGPTSMSMLDDLKPLFAQSSLFLNADGSLPESRRPTKKGRGGGRGGGKWNRNAGKRGEPLPPKIGQGGTLDPLASGVLVIGVGDGTKKLQTYLDGAKEYLTVGLLGTSTTSYDSQDPILYRAPHSQITADTLLQHLPAFRGSISQAPPLYSAVRIDGMRLFEYARQGKELPRPIEKRKVEVKQLQLNAWFSADSHKWKEPATEVPDEEKALVGKVRQLAGEVPVPASEGVKAESTGDAGSSSNEQKDNASAAGLIEADKQAPPAAFGLTMSVGGGTYVRSIVHDLAREAGSAAHVVVLRRTRQGQFTTDRWYRKRVQAEISEAGNGTEQVEGWTDREELAESPSQVPDAAGVLEHVKGNCIPWSVFEEAIKRIHHGTSGSVATKEGDDDADDEAANGPAAKKRKDEDGGATTTASAPAEEKGSDTSDGLQQWERILLEHPKAAKTQETRPKELLTPKFGQMANPRLSFGYDDGPGGNASGYERTGLLPNAGASNTMQVPGSPAGSSSRLHVDADIQDYYDDFDQLPPPHRLSTAHSPSPYPEALTGSPTSSLKQQQQFRSSLYQDPFANNPGRPSTDSIGFGDNEYPRRSSFGIMDNQQYGRSGAAAAGGYAPTPLHDDDDYRSYSQQQHGDDDATWGNVRAQYNASRDRYLARKEAQASAFAAGAGFGSAATLGAGPRGASGSRFSLPWSKEKGYGYDDYGGQEGGGRKSRLWWYIGGIGGLALLIIVIAISVTMAKSKGGNGSSGQSKGGVTGVTKSDPKDPSKFELDPRLKQSFWGLAYTPANAQYPQCGDTLDSVIEDVQLLSQLTTRIRLYGADCNVTQLVLEAINQTKVNMTVWPAVWVDTNATTYARQVSEMQDAITRYGTDRIEGITVGNEYLLNGGSEADLIQKITDMRTLLAGMNLPKTLPVGTGDAGSMITAALAAASDYIQANIHPWFGEVPVELASGWTWDYAMTNTPSVVLTAPNAPKYIIAEVGWPTGANATAFETLGPAIAGVPEVNTLLSSYVCQANANASSNALAANPGYFWFEAFDEPWKDVLYGGVEAHWGLFDSSKKLKDGIVIPDCPHP